MARVGESTTWRHRPDELVGGVRHERMETLAPSGLVEGALDALERQRYPQENAVAIIDDSMQRARSSVEELGIYSARWISVPPPYYSWPLEQRSECLKAPSIHHLCKSLLLENKKAPSQ